MIMAGASCDDIFVIVLFTTFLSMAQGGTANVLDFVNIPVSIVLGILLGGIFGFLLCLFFETAYAKKHCIRNSMKVINKSRKIIGINGETLLPGAETELIAGKETHPVVKFYIEKGIPVCWRWSVWRV